MNAMKLSVTRTQGEAMTKTERAVVRAAMRETRAERAFLLYEDIRPRNWKKWQAMWDKWTLAVEARKAACARHAKGKR